MNVIDIVLWSLSRLIQGIGAVVLILFILLGFDIDGLLRGLWRFTSAFVEAGGAKQAQYRIYIYCAVMLGIFGSVVFSWLTSLDRRKVKASAAANFKKAVGENNDNECA